MTNDLRVFNYGEAPVRVIDLAGEPWWVLADVCRVLSTGTMVGDGNGKFRPQSPVTRQELAQVLYNRDTRKT